MPLNYVDIAFDLLDAACREGWIEDLVVALRDERMSNPAFRRVTDSLIAGTKVGRHLTPERLVRLAMVLGALVDPDHLASALRSIGRDCEGLSAAASLKDVLIVRFIEAQREQWVDELLEALARQPLPEPAERYVRALMSEDPASFDTEVAADAERARQLWAGYATRSDILSRASEFRRVIEQRAIERALSLLETGLREWGRRICLVESGDSYGISARATGFLVGPDLVLSTGTLIDQSPSATSVIAPVFLFDHRALSSGELAGEPIRIGGSSPSLVAFSPPERLNYSLYRIAEPLGQARGWADLTEVPQPCVDDLLILLQHAEAKPLRMSVGRVVACNTDMLTYDAMTAGGASGAPCLTDQLEVVAIHSRKFAPPEPPLRKGGTRISAIASDIATQGVSLSSPKS